MASRANVFLAVTAASLALASFVAVFTGRAAFAGQQAKAPVEKQWTLTIRPAAVASGDRLLLKEIARPSDDFPEAAWRTMGETLLWKSPDKIGAAVSIPSDKVINALRYYLRDAPVEYAAPGQVAVQRGGSVLYQDDVNALAVEYLTQKVKDFPGQASIAKVDAPAFIFMDGPPGTASIEAAGELKPGVNKIYLVDAAEKGRPGRKTPLSAEISLVVQAAVATRPINANEGQIIPSMIAFERKDAGKLSGIPWDGSGGPWRVKLSVGQGQVVYKDNLEPMPAICRGDKVTLAYRGERIKLKAEAEAVTDGFLGKEITVRNLQSGVQVSGLVEGPGSVVVQ